jgi:predicted transcriptional regulator
MQKAVLISIQPKWVEKIASGEKTIEVRKTRPKLQTPFKCYIYATWNGNNKEILVKQDGQLFCKDWRKANGLQRASGKVIGEFICDRIDKFAGRWFGDYTRPFGTEAKILRESCLTLDELTNYLSLKNGYAWHISDLKIYDEPKDLSEFRTPCKMGDYPCCGICDYAVHGMDGDLIDCDTSLTRPPQSWCYVE